MKKNSVFLIAVSVIMLLSYTVVYADTGTINYPNHKEARGQIDQGSTYKHTTTVTPNTPNASFYVASRTYLEYSEYPGWTVSTSSAESWVVQDKANVGFQNHYHNSSSWWATR